MDQEGKTESLMVSGDSGQSGSFPEVQEWRACSPGGDGLEPHWGAMVS